MTQRNDGKGHQYNSTHRVCEAGGRDAHVVVRSSVLQPAHLPLSHGADWPLHAKVRHEHVCGSSLKHDVQRSEPPRRLFPPQSHRTQRGLPLGP